MISHTHKAIFIHVPKAAGTSIEAALGHFVASGLARDVQDHRSLRELQWPHGGIRQLSSWENCREVGRAVQSRRRAPAHPANRLTVTRAQYAEYFKFAVVRNPWARAFSWYRNVCADPLHRARLGVPADIDFRTFLNAHVGVGPLRPQTHWLLNFTGRIGVDMVCRFESLERDYNEVCRAARFPELSLPRLNLTHTRQGDDDYLAAYDAASRRLIEQRYRDEIRWFGYTFDGQFA